MLRAFVKPLRLHRRSNVALPSWPPTSRSGRAGGASIPRARSRVRIWRVSGLCKPDAGPATARVIDPALGSSASTRPGRGPLTLCSHTGRVAAAPSLGRSENDPAQAVRAARVTPARRLTRVRGAVRRRSSRERRWAPPRASHTATTQSAVCARPQQSQSAVRVDAAQNARDTIG
jgi:hypothetical protein